MTARLRETAPADTPIIRINDLCKVYDDGFVALKSVSLEIQKGEIFALLGPNGAGKTTLINVVCGIVNASSGDICVDGYDHVKEFRHCREMIGLVPQELTTETFESVIATLTFSRGLFGKAPDAAHLERVLRSLSLWDKKDKTIMTLSGGMKRRVLIAKALAHEPAVLFLDEPTAGVDVELRKDMWAVVRALRESGVTIILTTHYIEEAEQMADRIGIINNGEIILVQEKARLMRELGKKQLILDLDEPLASIPEQLSSYQLTLSSDRNKIIYSYDTQADQTGITALLGELSNAGIRFHDVQTKQRSLEDIFVGLVKKLK